ncbi:MAG: OmpA family protein [Pyrinomonadaceae bacterium]
MADENGKDIVDDAAEHAEEAAEGVVEKAKDMAGDAVDAAGDAVDKVKDMAGDAADKVGEVAGDAVDTVKDLAGGAADKIGDAAGAVTGAVGSAAGKGMDMAGDAADKVGDAAGAAVDKGKEVIGDAAGAVTGAAGAAADKVGDALGSVKNVFDGDGDGDSSSILTWLLPLLLLGLILVLGFMFCTGKTDQAANMAGNENSANSTGTETGAASVESGVSIEAKDGKYAITGTVKDEETKANILKEAEAVWGAGNVDVSGLKVDANAKAFKDGWWDSFKNLLPSLKDWKSGTIGWLGDKLNIVGDLPAGVADKIKSLFAGWGLPVSIAGAEDAAKAANEKAMEMLAGADSVEKVVEGLNASIINFASGKSDVPADAKPILEKAAEVLKKQAEGTTIEIGGHTDNQGNADANMKLSTARAESVKKALVDLGVNEKMLTSKGYGQTVPKGDNNTEEGRFQNRRIEYKVGGSGDAPTATTEKPAEDAKPAGEEAKPADAAPAKPEAPKQ